jgi:hypothetical protein
VRLITSFDRGAALSDPYAGVNVCLIAEDGRAVLHRVPPVNDPAEALSSMDSICAVSAGSAYLLAPAAAELLHTAMAAAAQLVAGVSVALSWSKAVPLPLSRTLTLPVPPRNTPPRTATAPPGRD